jgi:hypothetical protein
MIETERVEFGLFSTQISREWHMGHAVRAFSSLDSGPRASMDPRLLQLFIIPLFSIRTPLFKGFHCSFFDDLRLPRVRGPAKRGLRRYVKSRVLAPWR